MNRATMVNTDNVTRLPVPQNVTVEVSHPGTGLMTMTQYSLSLEIQSGLLTGVAIFGMVSNILNIRTFVLLAGWKDGVNLTFLSLAVSDLLLCCSALSIVVCSVLVSYEAKWFPYQGSPSPQPRLNTHLFFPLDPTFIGIYSLSLLHLLNTTTVAITVYLAVARCLCVVQPFKFRDAMTAKRTLLFVSAALALSVISRLPLLSQTGVTRQFDKRFNATRLVVWFGPRRVLFKDTTWLVVDMPVCVGAQVALCGCIAIMVRGLKAAARFRSQAVRKASKSSRDVVPRQTDDSTCVESSSKDDRVAKQMLLVSTIFVVCNSPKLVCFLTTNIEPDFDFGGRYQNLYQTSMMLASLFDTLNSSLNIIVYYKYNAKFRKTLLGANG